MPRKKPVKIIEKNLKTEKLRKESGPRKRGYLGMLDPETNIIEIHNELQGKPKFRTILHELLHLAFPEASETKIREAEKLIGNELWKQSYRQVDNKNK